LGIAGFEALEVPDVDGETALVAETVNGGYLFLEEYRFEARMEDLKAVVAVLAKLMPKGMEQALSAQLAIVADDHFRYLAEHATPVNAHVTLDSETKTVKGRMLWYEETLPPETLLYVGLNAVASRRKDSEMPAETVLSRLREALFDECPYLQLGGNETVGMGWCRATFLMQREG
jgi:CRISPR-associated protein Cmr4